jgi:hypothetical protein
MSAKQGASTTCVCGHADVHHNKRNSPYAGLMADFAVPWACGWADCDCPRYALDAPDAKGSSQP